MPRSADRIHRVDINLKTFAYLTCHRTNSPPLEARSLTSNLSLSIDPIDLYIARAPNEHVIEVVTDAVIGNIRFDELIQDIARKTAVLLAQDR